MSKRDNRTPEERELVQACNTLSAQKSRLQKRVAKLETVAAEYGEQVLRLTPHDSIEEIPKSAPVFPWEVALPNSFEGDK